jgi:FecR protein
MFSTISCPLRVVAIVPLLLGIGLASPSVLAQQRVGINGAVNPEAMSIPPGGLPRRLVLGQDVVFNEWITTSAEGQTQILFIDQSTLSVGPNANMVIDEFVYDPNAGTGKLAASLTRGVFRFVGGKLSKQENAVTMRTPTATMGIRGGVMLVDLAPGGKLSVIFVYGKGVTITGLNGVSQTITRPGFEVTVSGPGASPSDPSPAPPGATAALLAQLDGRAGRHGGASTVPTEVMVIDSGVDAISANVATSIQAAAQTQPSPQPPNVSPTVQLVQVNLQNATVPGATTTATPIAGGPTVSVAGTPIPTTTPPITAIVTAPDVSTPASPNPTPVVSTPASPNPTPVVSSPASPNPPPVVSSPTPSNPTPVASQPTPSNPTPVASQPTPSNPTPVVSTPASPNPTPVVSTPTSPNPTPVVSQPTPSNPTPVVSAPTSPNPTPVVSSPTSPNPTPVVSQPTPSNPTPVASQPTSPNPTPVASQPTSPNPTPVASRPTPSNPTPGQEYEEHERRHRSIGGLYRFPAVVYDRLFSRINKLSVTFSGTVPSNRLLPNGLCQCQYLHWGHWMADSTHPLDARAAQRPINNFAFRSTARLPHLASGMFAGIRSKP